MGLTRTFFSLFFFVLLDFIQSQYWTHYTVLDGDGRFHLSWTPPENKSGDSEIIFKIELKARGYFGFGFSPNGGMPGSDIVTGWIKDGEVYFQDRYADDFTLPPIDSHQDYELIRACENDTFTVFEFRRKLDTCDENDMVIDDSTMRLIYAYSDDDPEFDDPFYHYENRGVKSAFLLESKQKEDEDLNLASLPQWDITAPGIDFSSYQSLYWCKIFRTPNVTEKQHIIYIKPMIQEGHEQFVHHMAMYECVGGTPEEYAVFLDHKGHECWKPSMPLEMQRCQGFSMTYGVGGQGTPYPKNVGWPIFPNPGTYYLFEIHYDNPQLMNAKIDRSGFKFYYTPHLREFDSGLLMIGSPILARNYIPPRQERYVMVGHSSPPCAPWVEKGIKVFAVFAHAHLLARDLNVRHFRGNKELPAITHDKNYDFKYQNFRFLKKEIDILPGDQVTVECIFNSTERSNVTFGGESSFDEMCMGFLLYYPRSTKFLVFSAPSFDNINKVLDTNITKESDVIPALRNYDWAKADIDRVQKVMRYSEHEAACSYLDFPNPAIYPTVTYPKDLIPYEPKSTCNDAK